MKNYFQKTWRFLLIFFLTFIATILSSRMVELLPPTMSEEPYRTLNYSLSLLLTVVLAAVIWRFVGDVTLKLMLVLATIAMYCSVVVCFAYKGMDYGILGDSGDQGFLTAILYKSATQGFFSDPYFKDLFCYYPHFFYYLLGKLSLLIHEEPFKMLKISMIYAPVLIIFTSFFLWRKILSAQNAFLISLALLFYQDWPKISSWLAMTMLIPWWLYYVEGITLLDGDHAAILKKKSSKITAGILGAIIIVMQYYWLFAPLIGSILILAFRFFSDRDKKAFIDGFIYKLTIAGYALLFSCFYWIPYAYDLIVVGNEPMQNRWYGDWMGVWIFKFSEPSFIGIFFLIGILFTALTIEKKLSAYLLILLAGAYLWVGIGMIGVYTKTPNLHFKMQQYFVDYLLVIISLYAAGELLTRLQNHFFTPRTSGKEFIWVAIFLLPFLNTFRNALGAESAKIYHYPAHEVEVFKKLTDNQYKNAVVLCDDRSIHLTGYLPIYLFQAMMYHSHPSALYHQRFKYQFTLSRIVDEEIFGLALLNNKYNQIDYLYFNSPDLRYILPEDHFPFDPIIHEIKFKENLFIPAYFEKRVFENNILYKVKNEKNYLLEPGFSIKKLDNKKLIDLYTFMSLFRPHLPKILQGIKTQDVSGEIMSRFRNNPSDVAPFYSLLNLKQSYDTLLSPEDLSITTNLERKTGKYIKERFRNDILKVVPDGPDDSLKQAVIQYLGVWLNNKTEKRTYKQALDLLWSEDQSWKYEFKQRWKYNFCRFMSGKNEFSNFENIRPKGFKEKNFATFLIPHIEWWANLDYE